ncbi:hypothetical protein [Actomonas aquatica]|uniref:Uncharacterized protein n=1 Tax=Actomonas aquatica TaxID=2866162 RepID=A0ABZ1C2R2_9BACT|nr:hypothetical protein [Opitutus sp. WL0086]WRQ85992.1 hypothetical protein K1X11_014355 [Opitutus sp. WL0086]
MKTTLTLRGAAILGALTTTAFTLTAGEDHYRVTDTPTESLIEQAAAAPNFTPQEEAEIAAASSYGANRVLLEVLVDEDPSKVAMLHKLGTLAADQTAAVIANVRSLPLDGSESALRHEAVQGARAAKTGLLKAAREQVVGHDGISDAEVVAAIDAGVIAGAERGSRELGLDVWGVVVTTLDEESYVSASDPMRHHY